MTNKLKEIFVYVKDEDVQSFINNYTAQDSEVLDKYSEKIAFLGSSGKIVTHGNVYNEDEVYVGNTTNAPSSAKIVISATENTKPTLVYSKEDVDKIIGQLQSTESSWLSLYGQYFMMQATPYIGEKKNDFVFCCVPDMHTCFEWMTNYHLTFLNAANKLNNQCTLFTSAGDILFSGKTTVTKAEILSDYIPKYKAMIDTFANNGIAFAAGLGGHDFNFFNRVNYRDTTLANNLTKEEQRTHLIQPCVDAINNKLSSTYEAVISDDPSVCYYYVRNKVTGHITVMLDETDHPWTIENENLVYDVYGTACYSQAQLRWVIDLLLNLPDNKYVAFHNHMGIVSQTADVALTCAELKKIIIAFIRREPYAGFSGSDDKGFSWSTPAADFKNCKGMFVGLFKGHNHVQEYSKIENTFHQIGSVNPDGYPFGTNAYCYTNLFGGDVYVVRNQELRNLHYGKSSMKSGGDGTWYYKKFVNRWLDNPLIVLNNEPAVELDDSWEILQTLTAIKRTQNGKYYIAVPTNGQLLGKIQVYSTAFSNMPDEVGQYTYADGSYTATGGNYLTKNAVEWDATSNIVTINDDGAIVAKANAYILIGWYGVDTMAQVVKKKVNSSEIINSLKDNGCDYIDDAMTSYPNISNVLEGKAGLLFTTATTNKADGSDGTATKGAIIRTGYTPTSSDTIVMKFSTTSTVDGAAKTLFGTRTNSTTGNSFTTFIIANKIRSDYDNPGTQDSNRYTIVPNTLYEYTRTSTGDTLNGSELKDWTAANTGEYTTTIPVVIGGIVSKEADYSNSVGYSNAANFLTNTIVHSWGVKNAAGKWQIYLVTIEDNKMIDLVSGTVYTCETRGWEYNYNTAPYTTIANS